MNLRALGAADIQRTADGHEIGRLGWGYESLWVCSCAAFRANARWKDEPRCEHTDTVSASAAPATA